jgi:hypothetical protein
MRSDRWAVKGPTYGSNGSNAVEAAPPSNGFFAFSPDFFLFTQFAESWLYRSNLGSERVSRFVRNDSVCLKHNKKRPVTSRTADWNTFSWFDHVICTLSGRFAWEQKIEWPKGTT